MHMNVKKRKRKISKISNKKKNLKFNEYKFFINK
jgi:hypothetical protein